MWNKTSHLYFLRIKQFMSIKVQTKYKLKYLII